MDTGTDTSPKAIQTEIETLSKLLLDISYDITKIKTDDTLTEVEREKKLKIARQAEEHVTKELGEKQLQLTFFKK